MVAPLSTGGLVRPNKRSFSIQPSCFPDGDWNFLYDLEANSKRNTYSDPVFHRELYICLMGYLVFWMFIWTPCLHRVLRSVAHPSWLPYPGGF